MEIILKNGRIVDPINNIDKTSNLYIKDTYIEDINDRLEINNSYQVFDVSGKLVIPGIIDAHVHIIRPKSYLEGYRMLVKAGVTTAVEYKGPVDEIIPNISKAYGLNIAVLEGVSPGNGVSKEHAKYSEISEFIDNSLYKGAIGIKLLGGHFPLTPETTQKLIEIANKEKGFVAFHAGTTANGSNFNGFEEAIELANGLPLLIAHINAYCRGLINNPLEEVNAALSLLKESPNIISESHLAELNSCSGALDNFGTPQSHVTRNCLKMFGYLPNKTGIKNAILDKKAAVYVPLEGEFHLLWGEEAFQWWDNSPNEVYLSFPVNLRVPAIICASEKNDNKRFIIDAISTDGGAIPRNFILSYGLALVRIGVLTLDELIWKASYAPAQMYGFKNKGHLTLGTDADVTVVDKDTGRVDMTIINGEICMMGGKLIKNSGKLLTLSRGERYLQKHKVPYEIIDLSNSLFYKGREEFNNIQDIVLKNK